MKIKTALILCAGLGKRLNPITLEKPKPLLKLNNITLLENTINLIKELGIKKIILNTFHLKDQIKVFLKEKKRPEIISAIAEARSHGDLKENAEYHAAKEQQAHNEGRIQEIEDLIARANVIDVTKINNDGKVIFGSTVYLQNLDTSEKIDYKLVSKDEADLKKKLIHFKSPIGKGLIGKNKKDLVEINTPAGIKNFEIKDVKYI